MIVLLDNTSVLMHWNGLISESTGCSVFLTSVLGVIKKIHTQLGSFGEFIVVSEVMLVSHSYMGSNSSATV